MPVDKFGRMSDTKTKDTGVSLTYINNNYVRSDGETPLTGSLNMRGNTIYNVADPVNPQDVATKVYVETTTKNLFIDENDNIAIGLNIDMEGNKIFSLPEPEQDNEPATKKYVDDLQTQHIDKIGNVKFDRNINMNFHNIRNVGLPKDEADAVPRRFVDGEIRAVEEKIQKIKEKSEERPFFKENGNYQTSTSIDMKFNKLFNLQKPTEPYDAVTKDYVDYVEKEIKEKLEKKKQIIAVHARYCGPLKKGEYQFKFNGANFVNCEEIVGKYEDFKGSITGFVIPHSGHIKKIICETLLYRSLENIANFILDFITEHKKDVQLSDITFLEKAGYVDIEDVLKKGIDELKKNLEKENIFNENGTFLETSDNEKSLFQIVKFEKSFNPKDYLTVGALPKIISSVLIENMDIKILGFRNKTVGIGGIIRKLNNDYIPLSEEDVINIKTNNNPEERIPLFDGGNMKRIFSLKLRNFTTTGLNYNFTFLIELDPL